MRYETSILSVDLGRRVIRLNALHVRATYSGHLEGPFTREQNDARVQGTLKRANRFFGNRPVVVVDPERIVGRPIEGFEHNGQPVHREFLPPVCCIADLESSEVPGTDACASGLIVAWFTQSPPTLLEVELAEVLLEIDWDAKAENYWY